MNTKKMLLVFGLCALNGAVMCQEQAQPEVQAQAEQPKQEQVEEIRWDDAGTQKKLSDSLKFAARIVFEKGLVLGDNKDKIAAQKEKALAFMREYNRAVFGDDPGAVRALRNWSIEQSVRDMYLAWVIKENEWLRKQVPAVTKDSRPVKA